MAATKKRRIPHWKKLREERAKQAGRRRARIAAAIGFETLGPHPGQAVVWWSPSIYMAHDRRTISLPGLRFATLVGDDDELVAMVKAMKAGIEAWGRGEMVEGGFVCNNCKEEKENEQ